MTCLRLPQGHTSGCKRQKRHTSFYSTFPSLQDPMPQSSFLSSPFQIFPQSLSLRQVSHSIARKEADILNSRYSPNLFAFYLPGICRFQSRDFLMEQVLSNTHLKTTNQPKRPNVPLTDSGISNAAWFQDIVFIFSIIHTVYIPYIYSAS